MFAGQMSSSVLGSMDLNYVPSTATELAQRVEKLEEMALGEGMVKKTQPSKGVPYGRRRKEKREQLREEEETHSADTEDEELDAILSELHVSLEAKKRDEERLQHEINEILATSVTDGGSRKSRTFERAASQFNKSMVGVESDARRLADSLREVSKLADAISGKVAELDLAKTRVVECLQLAGDMRDLSTCSDKVGDAIASGDWSTAAELVHRFLTLDKAVFQLRDDTSKDAGTPVVKSYEVMEKARDRLREEFARGMDSAIEGGDEESMKKYLRLFPMIHEHEAGLRRLSDWLKREIAREGGNKIQIMKAGGTEDSRSSVLYADTLYLFFDVLADLLDKHHTIVEAGYGPDRVLDLVHMVQGTIDTVVCDVIDSFRRNRQFNQNVKAVERATKERERETRSGGNDGKGKEDRPDPLFLDIVLSEVALMHKHTETYWRFLKKKIVAVAAQPPPKSPTAERMDDEEDEVTREERKKAEVKRAEERANKLRALLHKSGVGVGMQDLVGRYILMEQYYMAEMVRKAIAMDRPEEKGHSWSSSSMVEDTLFVVRKVVQRALSSASTDAAAATVNNVVGLLETTLYRTLADAVELGFPSSSVFSSDMLASVGGVVPTAGTSTSKLQEQREAYLCTLNNARLASELIRHLKGALLRDSQKGSTRSEADKLKLSSALSALDDVARRMEQLAARGCSSVAKVAVRPKVKNSCEQYMELDHELSKEQLEEFQSVDPFIQSFCVTTDRLLTPFTQSLAPENYQDLLLVSCDEVARCLQSAVLRSTFNRFGAVQLLGEISHVTRYLSELAGFAAREKFAKLQQIACILNVEDVKDARELWQEGAGMARTLGTSEFKKILIRRTDLAKAEIQNMELIS